MRRRKFVAPNFKCALAPKQPDLEPLERLAYGASKEEVEKRLAKQFPRYTATVVPYNFQEWLDRAREATKKLIDARTNGGTDGYNAKVWGVLREYLFQIFEGNCAYCEGSRAGVTEGAVEHYRPKGKLSDGDFGGYYWLAYDYLNYLPGCPACNTQKGSKFPLVDESKRVREPPTDPFDRKALAAEQPVLVNPAEEDPFPNQLTFKVEWDDQEEGTLMPLSIVAQPKSERVDKTIKLLDLNRHGLQAERVEEVSKMLQAFILNAFTAKNPVLQDLREGRRRFSAAGLLAVQEFVERLGRNAAVPPPPAAGDR